METGQRAYCGNCGSELRLGDRFCRACGVSAEGVGEAPTATLPAPASREAARPVTESIAAADRRRWLRPALAAAALLIAVLVVAMIVLRTGEDEQTLTERATPVLAPVDTAVTAVARSLADTNAPRDLAATATAAETLEEEATGALGAARVLEVSDNENRARALLVDFLEATREYAARVGAAAQDLTPPHAQAAVSAAQAAEDARGSLAAVAPDLPLPAAREFRFAEQLPTIAAAESAAGEKAETERAAARAYVQKIDRLLTNSAETRGDLGALISDVQAGTIAASEARARIAAIINQRQDLQNAVASAEAPPAFERASDLLRQSIKESLDDDFAIQGWINAWYDVDEYSYGRFFAEHQQATARASAAKRAFVEEYNRVRARVLKLGRAPSGDRY